MSKMIYILIGFTGFASWAFCQVESLPEWQVYNRDPGRLFSDGNLAMANPGFGWAGGSDRDQPLRGMLLQLIDGKWVPQEAPEESARMTVMDVDDLGHLWVCLFGLDEASTYEKLKIAHYNGKTWTIEIASPGIFPQVLDMVTSEEGWIGGNHGLFLHYKNGVWRKSSLVSNDEALMDWNVLDLAMVDSKNGWAVGQRGLIAKYQNGEWRPFPLTPSIRKLSFRAIDPVSENEAWAVDVTGAIVNIKNGSWRLMHSPVEGAHNDIDMLSSTNGWIVGGPSLLLHYDGVSWKQRSLAGAYNLTAIQMLKPDDGWIAGAGVILKTSDREPRINLTEKLEQTPIINASSDWSRALDFDGDGDQDLITSRNHSLTFYENKGIFEERPMFETVEPGLDQTQAYGFADIDGDGDIDLCYWSWMADGNLVFRNKGDGRLGPPEQWSKLDTEKASTASMSFTDVDLDGDLDIYITRSGAVVPKALSNLLYLNNGDGQFGLTNSLTGERGGDNYALWGDLDGDGDQDLITPTYYHGDMQLYLNQMGLLEEKKNLMGTIRQGSGGMNLQGCLIDLDLDTDPDLIFFNGALRVYENDGSGRFSMNSRWFPDLVTRDYGGQSMIAAGDLNHDGHQEILLQIKAEMEERVYLFSWDGDRYIDIAEETGIAGVTGSWAVFEDWDGDGDLDVFISRGFRGSDVLLSNTQNDQNWLKVAVHGVLANRMGIGTSVSIYDAGFLGQASHLRGWRELGSGAPASRGQWLHFGLDSQKLYDIRVSFPGGHEVVRHSISSGQHLTIHEFPVGVRHGLLAWQSFCRALMGLNYPIEGLKFLVALVMSILFRFSKFKNQHGHEKVFPMAPPIAFYLGMIVFCSLKTGLFYRVAPLAGLFILLVIMYLWDRYNLQLRDSQYIGQYKLLDRLGEGGMGVVYRARDQISRKQVALKVLSPKLFSSETARNRFLREAAILKQLEPPNIVSILDAGEANGFCYLSMELLKGNTLEALIEQKPDPAWIIDMARGICSALDYIHKKGIVHRDLKCENLMITGEWQEPSPCNRLKIMDFGLSRAADMKTLTVNPGIMGTLAYMSPEQALGQPAGPASDIYSLGVTLYRMFSGAYPFEAANDLELLCQIRDKTPRPLRQAAPTLSSQLEMAVGAMLQPISHRPQNVEQVISALEATPEARPGRYFSGKRVSKRMSRKTDAAIAYKTEPPENIITQETTFAIGMSEAQPVLNNTTPAFVQERAVSEELTQKWRHSYQMAGQLEAQGRDTEARVMRLVFMENLERILSEMAPEQREQYLKEHGVGDLSIQTP